MEIFIAMALQPVTGYSLILFCFSGHSYVCPVFCIEQFGGIHPQFAFLSIPWFSNWRSYSETSFQNLFWDSDVQCPYYISSPL
jgi:hypothetical protein